MAPYLLLMGYVAWHLENGLDDISAPRHEDQISAYEANRPSWKAVVTSAVE